MFAGVKRCDADIGRLNDGGHIGIRLCAAEDDGGVPFRHCMGLGEFGAGADKDETAGETCVEDASGSGDAMDGAVPRAEGADEQNCGRQGWIVGGVRRHKAIDIGAPGMFVDTGAVDAGRNGGVQWSDNGSSPAALQRRPPSEWTSEAIVDAPLAFTGGINDEGIDFEEGGDAGESSGNHPGAGKVVVAFDDDIGAELFDKTQNGNERHERGDFGDVDVMNGESVPVDLGRLPEVCELRAPFAGDCHHVDLVPALGEATGDFVGVRRPAQIPRNGDAAGNVEDLHRRYMRS